MNRNDLRAVAAILDNHGVHLDTYSLISVATDLAGLIEAARQEFSDLALAGKDNHDALVRIALATPSVMDHLAHGKKINAIKELRIATSCGLKAAKDAVEAQKVVDAVPDVALTALREKLGVN